MKLVEKYRPKKLDEVIDQTIGEGQPSNLTKIRNALSRGEGNIPAFMLTGKPGTGKTTIAQCIAFQLFGGTYENHYNGKYHEYNASDDRGIDVVREEIKRKSEYVGFREIVLDESDEMTDPAQNALRRIMENSKSTVFVLIGNRPWKFIEALQSRCCIIRFRPHDTRTVVKYIIDVLRKEGIAVTRDIQAPVEALAKRSKGDLRRALNDLETLINKDGQITMEGVVNLEKADLIGQALKMTITGNFEQGKQMLVDAFLEKANMEEFFDELSENIDTLQDREVKIRLHRELGKIARACTVSADPIIQLKAFLAFAWLAPHMSKGCPAINDGGN